MAYKMIRALHRSPLIKALPRPWRRLLDQAQSYAYQVDHVRALRSNPARIGRLDAVRIRDTDNVIYPGMWLVELFTPSQVPRLYERLNRMGWSRNTFPGDFLGGTEALAASRAGTSRRWWTIADLTASSHRTFDAHPAALPPGVRRAHLRGVSIGRGITAVAVGFEFEPSVADQLNSQLHAPHRPALIRRKGHPALAQTPAWVLYQQTQRARTRVHSEMRAWMSSSLHGAFAARNWAQPLLDVILFDHVTVDGDRRRPEEEEQLLRALGIVESGLSRIESPDLPGWVVEAHDDKAMTPDMSSNAWTLWGNRSAGEHAIRNTGHHDLQFTARIVGELALETFTGIALTALLQQLRADASAAHDNAARLHGGADSGTIRRLRKRLLTASLDLVTLEADVKEFARANSVRFGATFHLVHRSWGKPEHLRGGRKPREPRDLLAAESAHQKRLARELVAFDAAYREVLTTVAALSSSINSRRAQAGALLVSLVSLVVAAVTLYATTDSALLEANIERLVQFLSLW